MSVPTIWWFKSGKGADGVWFKRTLLSFPFDCNAQWTALGTLPLSLFLSPCLISSPLLFSDSFFVSTSPLSISAFLFLLHLFNLNDLVISVIFKKKKKKRQISKIEETNILIKNPKQKRIKSKLIQPKKKKKKKLRVLRCVQNILSQFNWQCGLRILE